jgi:hypothetical protein
MVRGIEARSARVTPEGELWGHTWTPKPQPTTRWWRAGELAAPPGNTDHYVSMGLTEQPGTERTRAKQADVTALLAGAWADVDVVSPWHAKPGLATTHDEALGALTAAMMPTVALRTPGGVQGFWLCETAIELEPAAMRQHLSDVGATFQAHSDVVFDRGVERGPVDAAAGVGALRLGRARRRGDTVGRRAVVGS